jgi:hypothetical protein
MTPHELSEEVREVVTLAQDRVGPGSIGAEQYHVPGRPQQFETMELRKLAAYMLEESLDLINYGVMMSIRAQRLQAAADHATGEAMVDRLARQICDDYNLNTVWDDLEEGDAETMDGRWHYRWIARGILDGLFPVPQAEDTANPFIHEEAVR